jgi:hypothetical protein
MKPNISQAARAQHRIANGVQQYISITMANGAFIVFELYATDP